MKNSFKGGALTENSAGLGSATRKMVRDRALELAVTDGRSAHEATKAEWVEARWQLTGGAQMNSNDPDPDVSAEFEPVEPVPGSTGTKVPVAPGEDEDEEGRRDNERLVDEGIAGAEDDQRRQAEEYEAEKDRGAKCADTRGLFCRETSDSHAGKTVTLFCYQAKKWIGASLATLSLPAGCLTASSSPEGPVKMRCKFEPASTSISDFSAPNWTRRETKQPDRSYPVSGRGVRHSIPHPH